MLLSDLRRYITISKECLPFECDNSALKFIEYLYEHILDDDLAKHLRDRMLRMTNGYDESILEYMMDITTLGDHMNDLFEISKLGVDNALLFLIMSTLTDKPVEVEEQAYSFSELMEISEGKYAPCSFKGLEWMCFDRKVEAWCKAYIVDTTRYIYIDDETIDSSYYDYETYCERTIEFKDKSLARKLRKSLDFNHLLGLLDFDQINGVFVSQWSVDYECYSGEGCFDPGEISDGLNQVREKLGISKCRKADLCLQNAIMELSEQSSCCVYDSFRNLIQRLLNLYDSKNEVIL